MTIKSFNYESITEEKIKEILESAFIPFGVDDDGDIYTKEDPKVYIQLATKKKRLTLFCMFKSKDVDIQEKLTLVNEINIQNYFPKVMVMPSGNIRFDYDLDITSEITSLYFVINLRNFSKRIISIIRNEDYSSIF